MRRKILPCIVMPIVSALMISCSEDEGNTVKNVVATLNGVRAKMKELRRKQTQLKALVVLSWSWKKLFL